MKRSLFILYLCFAVFSLQAQTTLTVNKSVKQHKFILNEVGYLEDSSNRLTFADIRKATPGAFKINHTHYPNNVNTGSTYWFRVKIKFDETLDNNSIIEFFDQTTDEVTAYMPDMEGNYIATASGAKLKFDNRLYHHKNFEFLIKDTRKGEYTYYFKVKSRNLVTVIIVYRTLDYFVRYALNEYLWYGLFYGMILIFCFHNLLMFLAVRRKQYLYYVFYVLSVGFYEMSADGIAFQYLWPGMPLLNTYGNGIALYLTSFFALIFSKQLLQVKQKSPGFNKLINTVLAARTVYFLYCLLLSPSLFVYKFVEVIPLSIVFITGLHIYRKGFKPARFFVLAYSFLFVGFMIRALRALGYTYFLPASVSYYSLSLCFIIEMVLLSFAIGDQVRILRREKDAANAETIRQMKLNSQLKDSINLELEQQVQVRTREVVEKSNEILGQNSIIENQNKLLVTVNKQLEAQAGEILRMNVLLEKDNVQLKTNIGKVSESRALSAEMDFKEFSAEYPDQETCFKFLAALKWKDGYICTRCQNTTYCAGRLPHSRRCTKCSYEESALHNTIFQNNRIPINKAFYLTYLIYCTNGSISSHQLAERLSIRQSTCWTYAIRIKKVMQEKKRSKKKTDQQQGWSTLVV
ncbi:7TM diverse intracellular signaling domain-containing protein [Mucilaginibacter terrigena]|uniref:7TM diverse intracellular signaling domain-containing protein n=1 Tax=Mucilaginibacter terrigena TaxID=2492395 RepID=UPI001EF15646|nr:7TM diverse intracellular signaling domain-containing protein [Mucilaginibacter terrigena]